MKWEFYKAKFFISILELVSNFSIAKAGSIPEFLQYYDCKNQMALEFNLNFIQKSVRNPLQKLEYTKEITIAIPSGILNIKATGFI